MKVYADKSLNVLYIEGVSQGPCASYQFTSQGDLISAFRPDSGLYDFVSLPFSGIQNQAGMTFPNVQTTLEYLNALTIPSFPLRFTVGYPLTISGNEVDLDPSFISSLNVIDGGFG